MAVHEYLVLAITEVVLDLIWDSDFIGPQEIWAPRNLVPKKFGLFMKLPYNDFYAGPKLLRALISQGSNFMGPK